MRKQLLLLLVIATTFLSCKKQENPIHTINIPKTQYSVAAQGGIVEIYLQCDAQLDIKLDDQNQWLTRVETRALQLGCYTFQCKPNDSFEQRKLKITFSVVNSTVEKSIEVIQEAAKEDQPMITAFSFLVKDNPNQLLADVHGVINADSTISVRIPYILVDKKLKPTIAFVGKSVAPLVESELDFTAPIEYVVENGNGKKIQYTVVTNSYNGLPVVTIETENRYINPDKNIYVKGIVKIDNHTNFPEGFNATTRLKGRGNATWVHPKKPYRLKLDEKASILKMPSDKDWVLLAGYTDKSLMRLDIYLEVSRTLKLSWTPKMEFVDLFINGKYEGNYMIGEHVKTSKDRLNVDENNGGMLIEIDSYYASEPVNFVSPQGWGYSFKTPDPDNITTEQFDYCKNTISDFEARLYGADFADPVKGYRAVIDAEKFAAWWMVNNVCTNIDMNQYFYKTDKEAKLAMGPVWDAEWSQGIGWSQDKPARVEKYIMSCYFDRLFEDPYFKQVVKTVWEANKVQIKENVINRINKQYNYLIHSQESNFARWNVLSEFILVGYVALTTYNNEVQYVKDFFLRHYDWLDGEITKY